MIHLITLLLICSLLPGTLVAQNELPAFGKVDKEDLEMKDCAFDKGAEAVILIDDVNIFFERGSKVPLRQHTEHRIRIKILKEKAFERANIKLYFRNSRQTYNLFGIAAMTYNLGPNGEVVTSKIEKKQILEQAVGKDFSAYAFSFPDVKVGSIIEYKYDESMEYIFELPTWYFQDEIPTRWSRLRVAIPEYYVYTSQMQTSLPIEKKKTDEQSTILVEGGAASFGISRYSYLMKDVPGLREEPYMGAAKDYRQRIEFQLSQVTFPNSFPVDFTSNWEKLTKELLENDYFGKQMRKNIHRTSELDNQLSRLTSKYDKLTATYNFVRQNMEWNGETGIYCENIDKAWEKRRGSLAQINMLLINLLRDADIEAYPMLCSTRNHGKVNTAFPFEKQFNEIVAYVIIDDIPYIVDASDKYNPVFMIPHDIMTSEGFVVDKNKGGFVSIWDPKMRMRQVVSMQGAIDEEGILSGTANVSSYGYARNPRIRRWKDGKEKFIQNYYASPGVAMKIDDVEINNLENDSLSLDQKLKFSLQLNSSGEYKYFSVNLFTGLEKNPFTAEKRFTDIEFGANQYYTLVGNFTIPEGYTFEELPKDISMIMPDTSIVFSRFMSANDNTINVRMTLQFVRPTYFVDEYQEFREFYKKLYGKLNEQIAIKKK
jgi:transglutaminase-like putative cysteine protease